VLAVLGFGLLLAGCGGPLVWHRLSINETISPASVQFIVPGRTRVDEVVRQLGSPDDITEAGIGPVFRYRFTDAKRFRITPTWPLPFIFPVLQLVPGDLYTINMSAGGAGGNEFHIIFDADWTARGYAFAHHAEASTFFALPFDIDEDEVHEDRQ
jgi:hypothetical protein